jgi:DNA (cytosine-5)-methyltransferase 1
MMRREGFLRVKEAAELLGVAPNTVRSWGEAGKIPQYRHPVNNCRLYKRAELERLLKKVKRSASGGGRATRDEAIRRG